MPFAAAAARRVRRQLPFIQGGEGKLPAIGSPTERTEAVWRNPLTLAKPSFARSTRTCAATGCAISSSTYGNWLIAGVVLFLAVERRAHLVAPASASSRRGEQVEQLARSTRTSAAATPPRSPQQLDELCRTAAARRSALRRMFTRAALALQQNDIKTAIATYKAIADDSGLPAALPRRGADPPDRARVRPAAAAGGDRPA